MSVPGEGFAGLVVEAVNTEEVQDARDLILADCLGMKMRGAIDAYADVVGPVRVGDVSWQARVPTTDPRFELQLAMDASDWADKRVEDWCSGSKPLDKELAVICQVYGLGYGWNFYYDDLLGALMDARDTRNDKLADHRKLLDPYDDILADMWIQRAYPQNQTGRVWH